MEWGSDSLWVYINGHQNREQRHITEIHRAVCVWENCFGPEMTQSRQFFFMFYFDCNYHSKKPKIWMWFALGRLQMLKFYCMWNWNKFYDFISFIVMPQIQSGIAYFELFAAFMKFICQKFWIFQFERSFFMCANMKIAQNEKAKRIEKNRDK